MFTDLDQIVVFSGIETALVKLLLLNSIFSLSTVALENLLTFLYEVFESFFHYFSDSY